MSSVSNPTMCLSGNPLPDGTFYPVESYTAMLRCIDALVEAGYTVEQARAAID